MKMVGLPKLFYSNSNTNNTNSVSRTNSNNHVNFSGTKSKSKMSTDVVQLSHKEESINKLLANKEDIAKMRTNGASQEAIAQKYEVTRAYVAEFLDKYLPNVQSDTIIFRNALKNYMSSNNDKQRNQAIEEVDKVLQKIATEISQAHRNMSFQDCLQDLRLKFVELANKKQGKDRIVFMEILQELKNDNLVDSVDSVDFKNKFVPYQSNWDKRQSLDFKTVDFEQQNLLKYLIDNSGLNVRQRYIIYSYLIEGKSLDEIANMLCRTTMNISQNLSKAAEKMNSEYRKIESNDYLSERVNLASQIMSKITQED